MIKKILTSPIFIAFAFFLFGVLLASYVTTRYFRGYTFEFRENILVEFHGVLFDILIVGILLFGFQKIGERELSKRRYREEMEGLFGREGESICRKFESNIRHLNRLGVGDIYLRKAYLKDADLGGVNLKGADLTLADLKAADLQGAILKNSICIETDFRGANLRGADFRKAKLKNAKVNSKDLRGTHRGELLGSNYLVLDLEEANLQRANLEGASLTSAKLLRANLKGANLNKADFLNAKLEGADLTSATLTMVKNLTIEQLSEVKTLYKSKLDPELQEGIKKRYPKLFER